jgi:hypothetical protein
MTFTAANAGLFSIDDRNVGTFTVTVEPVFCTRIYVCLPSACLPICLHSWAQSTMDRHRWYRSILSINTFGLILIDVIDPSVKDLFIFDRYYRQLIIKPYLTDGYLSIGTVQTQLIVSIHRSNLQF